MIVTFLAAAVAAQTAAPPPRPCRLPGIGEELRCGTLTVPEDRGRPGSSRRIALHVVVLPALGGPGDARRAPLFELAGGPGIAASWAAGFYASEGRLHRRGRDVVLVDQRGTGQSSPLRCRSFDEYGTRLEEMYPLDAVRRCAAELGRQADLRAYTTVAAADDIDAVRAWLGHERIDLLGFSYGTRLALEYARRHPERVRSMVLVGAVAPGMKMPENHPRDGQRALDLLIADCAADSACRAAYPRLSEDLASALARAGDRPELRPAGAPRSYRLTRDAFAEALRFRLYTPDGRARLPRVLHAAAAGDWAPLLEEVKPGGGPGFAEGLYLSVTCSEDTPFIDAADAKAAAAGTVFGEYRFRQQRRACAAWPHPRRPARSFTEVRSSVPTLILSGERDPVTPPRWAERIMASLSLARHVVVAPHAHVPDGLEPMACLDDVVAAFFAAGSADALDVSCLATLRPSPFTTSR